MDKSINQSDKSFWHHYIDFYEKELASFRCQHVLEFGVFKGASILWLMDLFPKADIYGVDILGVQPEWPQDKRVKYFQVNQGLIGEIKLLFKKIECRFRPRY